MTMSIKNKNKKGRAIFMKRSSMKIWIGKDGKVRSKTTGTIDQVLSNYDKLIEHMRDQAQSMVGSAVMALGQTQEVIIARAVENPKINPKRNNQKPIPPVNYTQMSEYLKSSEPVRK